MNHMVTPHQPQNVGTLVIERQKDDQSASVSKHLSLKTPVLISV
jgi:hypothetical protein